MDRLYYLTDEQFEQINRLLPLEGGPCRNSIPISIRLATCGGAARL
jgi:hypothetical protein